jgi:uncharacterized membrane protein
VTVRPHRRSGEDGYVAAELALGIGLLVFPVALLILTLPTWSERQTTARAIAREVSRVVAVAGVCDRGRAAETGNDMARNLGLAPTDVDVQLDCVTGGRLPRGGTVRASVTVAVPAVTLPGIGSVGAWSWTAHHSEPVDQYRSFE